MTAIERERDLSAELWERIRQIPLGPAEGWLTYGLVTLLAMTVAWSLDDAAWVLGNPDYGDYYIWAAILGVLAALGQPSRRSDRRGPRPARLRRPDPGSRWGVEPGAVPRHLDISSQCLDRPRHP